MIPSFGAVSFFIALSQKHSRPYSSPAMSKPLAAHAAVQVATVIESLAVLNPVSARAPLSDTHPAAVQLPDAAGAPPVGTAAALVDAADQDTARTLEVVAAAVEEAEALEIFVLTELADVAAADEEETAREEEEA